MSSGWLVTPDVLGTPDNFIYTVMGGQDICELLKSSTINNIDDNMEMYSNGHSLFIVSHKEIMST